MTWVRDALARLAADEGALGTSAVQWQNLRDLAMEYCQAKQDARRWDGTGEFDMKKVPTYDLLEGREIIV